MSNQIKTALISTLYTQAHGGVYTMLSVLVSVLQKMGYQVNIAYYMPYSVNPNLSVPIKQLGRKKIAAHPFIGELGVTEYAIGALLPELEFTHYYPNAHWKKLIGAASLHIVVTGHILSALPFYVTRKNFLVWVATPYFEDRKDRIKLFPWYRKWIDFLLISRIGVMLEKKLLRAGVIISLSHYSKNEFKENKKWVDDVIHVPIDTRVFFPDGKTIQPGLICFTARFLDPRKNIYFLLDVFAKLHQKIQYAKLCLVGDEITPDITKKLTALNIESCVEIHNYISRAELITKLQQTDVFVIPSYQEGLCISGLEAMACGCPIVSTRCGGPSDYIADHKNGYLVNFDSAECADKIARIIENRALRDAMSAHSLEIIQKNYSIDSIHKKWVQHIHNLEVENKSCQ